LFFFICKSFSSKISSLKTFPHSVPQPPHNKGDYENRVGGFEGNDDRYIFDFRPIMNTGFDTDRKGNKNNFGGASSSGNRRGKKKGISLK
jgi:hypothetical protein